MKTLHIRDSSFVHCEYNNNPTPPVTISKTIRWLRDGNKGSSNTIYTDLHLNECNGGIGWLLEPQALQPATYEFVKNYNNNFTAIWTYDKELIDSVPNAKFVPHGGCWIKEEDRKIHNKTKNFSIIASNKNILPGHQLRHLIIRGSGNKIDAFGPNYTPFKHGPSNKIEGLKEYRYHFTIENSKKDYYFTEKLIDCLITGTIPIYWGCPSISNFFNIDGFIIFNELSELKEKLKQCNEKHYLSKINAIKENFERALEYVSTEDWLTKNNII